MPGRRACDRCFKYKQKCNFEDDEEACLECELSKSKCTTLRLRVRQGRRPKVKKLGPEGSVQVWEVGSSSNSAVSVTKSYSDMPQSLPQLLSFCYFGAPKFLTVAELALDLRGNGLETYPSSHNSQLKSLASPFQVDSPETLRLFTDTYDLFMLGPSFAVGMRAAFQHSYLCSPILLHDIIAVLWTTVKRARNSIDAWDQSDVARGAISLQQLRTARIANIGDALAILALGQTLAAFDLLTSCNGSTSILRYSLTSISPWYESVANNPTLDPVIIASVFWDTLNCLVKPEIPVLKHISRNPPVVDRLAGFVTPLLPIFYDLCVASKKLKDLSDPGTDAVLEDLERIQQELLWWKPDPPTNLADNFSDQEILKMQAQATMYQTTALLFCHRILHPIGTLDPVAKAYADSIMSDFSKYSELLKPGTRLQNVGFPILLAAMEIQDLPNNIWGYITLSAAAPIFVSKVCALVDFVWVERRNGSTSFLLDLIARGPEFVVIP